MCYPCTRSVHNPLTLDGDLSKIPSQPFANLPLPAGLTGSGSCFSERTRNPFLCLASEPIATLRPHGTAGRIKPSQTASLGKTKERLAKTQEGSKASYLAKVSSGRGLEPAPPRCGGEGEGDADLATLTADPVFRKMSREHAPGVNAKPERNSNGRQDLRRQG